MIEDVIRHYDMLIDEGNDSVLDPPELRDYMNKWDGDVFLEMLGIDRVKSVLEIGCGTGRLAMRVAPFVRSFCGVDISPKTVDTARGHLSFDNVRLICADFMRYQFDERFDIIYSSLTFMHISEKAEAISKIREILKVGGRFVLSIDKNRSEWLDYGNRRLRLYPDAPEEIEGIMRASGLTVEKTAETEFAYIILAKKIKM